MSPNRLLETNLVVCYLIAYCRAGGVNVSTANVFEAKTSFSELIRHALNVLMFYLLNSILLLGLFRGPDGCECDEWPDVRFS